MWRVPAAIISTTWEGAGTSLGCPPLYVVLSFGYWNIVMSHFSKKDWVDPEEKMLGGKVLGPNKFQMWFKQKLVLKAVWFSWEYSRHQYLKKKKNQEDWQGLLMVEAPNTRACVYVVYVYVYIYIYTYYELWERI